MTRSTASGGAGRYLLLVGGLLLGAARAHAATSVAVLIGRDSKASRVAAAALGKMSGVRAEIFRLYQGTRELDRTVQGLKSGGFDRVVSLGPSAHEFFRKGGWPGSHGKLSRRQVAGMYSTAAKRMEKRQERAQSLVTPLLRKHEP